MASNNGMRTTMLILAFTIFNTGTVLGENHEQAVLAAQRQWIDSYNHRDEKTLAAIEADDFSITFGDGRVQKKPDQLTLLRKVFPHGAEYEIVVEASEVRVYGGAAVVSGVVNERGKLPNEQGVDRPFSQRSRYTDTWIWLNGRWRVVASHLSELK
jgi:ketosteroid isomerase-like protein